MQIFEAEEKLLNLLKNSYQNYNADDIKDALADDMTYDNTWVIPQITSKQEYLDYLVHKLLVMKEKKTEFNFLIVFEEGQGRPHLIFTPKNQGAFGCFTIEEQDGLIKALHLTPHILYGSMGYKDEPAFEKFVKNSNETKEDIIKTITGR